MLSVDIVTGDKGVVSIRSKYVPTTSYSFSVELDFGREPIGIFSARISLNKQIAQRYFSGIDTSGVLSVDVNPAFMSVYTDSAADSADTLV